ncbi:MAG TPA: rhomboid family intramembrane serine protease [Candidatus Krumholzibacteria bacterium]|nr:rhomboid family intramembrane serine protease [Candidatus Krumholzibacteria bacterium]
MFPLSDSPNPRGLPWITLALILANVLAFLLLLPRTQRAADPADPRLAEYVLTLARQQRDDLGGLTPADVPAGDLRDIASRVSQYDLTVFDHGSRPDALSLPDMLTSMFLHAGWLHLLGNMLYLWIYGNNAEDRLGRARYLLAYLGTGVAAALADAALRHGSGIPAVGASGAVSGVLGMYFIWFPRNKVRVLVILPPFLRTLELGARWVLGFYLVADNILPMLSGGGGGVAHGAHLGGFAAGAALAWLLSRREPAGDGTVDGELAAAQATLARRRPAAGAYQHVVRALDADPDAAVRPDLRAAVAEVRRRARTVPRRLPPGD